MENPPFEYQTNPHFFQPFLPGSYTHLTIPNVFFSKHIEGKTEQKTAKLRSDASVKTWEVNIDGRRFTRGWKDFATAQDLRTGDIIVFELEGDMLFNVTPFGPSHCEIQYLQSDHIMDQEKEEDGNKTSVSGNVLRKKNLKSETEPCSSLSYEYCFVAKVTASSLRVDELRLPVEAARSNALNRGCHKMIVVNEEGKSWTLNLRFKESFRSYYIGGGWTRFCRENKRKVRDLIPFNLVGDGETTPMICVCPQEECLKLMSKKRRNKKIKRRPNWVASSSSSWENRFVTIILTRYNIENSKLILPVTFTKINGINKYKEIILMDKHGVKRLTKLLHDQGRRGLGKGWKDFCEANDVLKIGEPFVLELIWEDATPVLKFCSKMKSEPI